MVTRTAVVIAIVYAPVHFLLRLVPVWALLSVVGGGVAGWALQITAAVLSYVLATYVIERLGMD